MYAARHNLAPNMPAQNNRVHIRHHNNNAFGGDHVQHHNVSPRSSPASSRRGSVPGVVFDRHSDRLLNVLMTAAADEALRLANEARNADHNQAHVLIEAPDANGARNVIFRDDPSVIRPNRLDPWTRQFINSRGRGKSSLHIDQPAGESHTHPAADPTTSGMKPVRRFDTDYVKETKWQRQMCKYAKMEEGTRKNAKGRWTHYYHHNRRLNLPHNEHLLFEDKPVGMRMNNTEWTTVNVLDRMDRDLPDWRRTKHFAVVGPDAVSHDAVVPDAVRSDAVDFNTACGNDPELEWLRSWKNIWSQGSGKSESGISVVFSG